MPRNSFEPPIAYDVPRILPDTQGVPFRLMRHYSQLPHGQTVLLVDGHYVTRDNPTMDEVAAAGEEGVGYFAGGHRYIVSLAVANQLVADGYTVGDAAWSELTTTSWGDLATSTWGAI